MGVSRMGKRWVKGLTVAGVAVALVILLAVGMVACRGGDPVARAVEEDLVYLKKDTIALTTSGLTGSDSTDRDLYGRIYAIHMDFGSSVSETIDLTLTQASPALTVLALTNYFTDTWFYPVVQETGSTGSGTSTYTPVYVADAIDVASVQGNRDTQIVTITLYWGQ